MKAQTKDQNDKLLSSRRGFLKGAGATAGAFVFGFSFPLDKKAFAQSTAASDEVNAWVVVNPDETVLIRIARIEMGQGSLTGLAQLVAEELECDWDKVSFDLVKPGKNLERNNVWGSQATGGSTAIRGSHEFLRRGGAAARAMLIQAAAQQWGVEASSCSVSKGVITHEPSGRTTSYGQVAELADGMTPPENLELKDPSKWEIIGKPVKRLDTLDKLDGSLVYGVDVSMPNMLVAVSKTCPVHGGELAGFDASAVEGMAGVKHVFRVNHETVAIVADTFWHAKKAMDALPVEWDEGPNANVSSESIAEMQREGLSADTPYVGHQVGNAREVLKSASRVIEADYRYPFQHHAPMEPLAATVLWTDTGCEMWAPTQRPEVAMATMSEASGHPQEACEIHTMRIGGSFGRRLATDYVNIATLVAKKLPGTPVKTMWTREEDMLHGRYHPVTQCRFRASLDDHGEVEALHVRISGQSITSYTYPSTITEDRGDPVAYQGLEAEGDMAIGYTFPNLLVDHAIRNTHIRPGYWRGVNLNQNALYMESFIDELAHETGEDPVEFRRKLMKNHPKNLAVLNKVVEGIGWDTPAPEGIHRGVAQIKGFGSYVAAAAEVSVTNGKLKIHRLVAATDTGYVVNPQQVKAQVFGSFVYGLSPLLYSECTVENGRIAQQNFNTYEVMRLVDMPEVEVHLVPSGGFWGGVGEPTIAVAAPAVLNAIFAATGKRIRRIPIQESDLA